MKSNSAPAPLFRDPVHDGAADPTILFHRQERSWWIVYTNRRANVECPGTAWYHGTDIGAASSHDRGANWRYRGILQGLEFEPGRNTFWAPEILWHESRYHMYVTYVRGVPSDWSGERRILHYVSPDLSAWSLAGPVPLSSDRVMDACVERIPNGMWRMWYKDEAHGAHTYAADSRDLFHWSVAGPAVTDCQHEGPNVFRWQGRYWMLTDPGDGLGVYRSEDAGRWERQENILRAGGSRPDDGTRGLHADVLVAGSKAFVLYFTHPGRPPSQTSAAVPETMPYPERRSSLQVAALEVRNGLLLCDRDAGFDLDLGEQDNWDANS